MATAIPFLRLYRKRLIFCGFFSFAAVLLSFWQDVGGFPGLGIFWDQNCALKTTPADVWPLLYFCSFLCFVIGGAMGRGSIVMNPKFLLGLTGETRFLLTRPMARLELIRRPAALAAVVLVAVPLAPVLLLGLWLWAVHAPALGQLIHLMGVVPPAHLWRFYVSAVSLGMCVYSLVAAQRWTATSDCMVLKLFAGFISPLLVYGQIWLVRSQAYRTIVLMGPPPGAGLDFAPSLTTILLHLAFAGAVLYGSWRLAEKAEM